MNVTFYGAAREVTGSMHLISTGNDNFLLDCGMFQGRRQESAQRNRVLPFDPRILTNVILSHAHIDHSGRLPMLVNGHFNGRIICTRATAAACEYLLLDSAKIQESDAQYLNYKTARSFLYRLKKSPRARNVAKATKNKIKKKLKIDGHKLNTEAINDVLSTHRLETIQPLYTTAQAEEALASFDGNPYRHPVTIGRDTTCTLYDAGHILGSAVAVIQAADNGRTFTIAYTGDVGRFDTPILKNPTMNFGDNGLELDLLIIESTYGNRDHDPVEDKKTRLKQVLMDTFSRGGSVLIPSFAFGRTQELIYVLHELYNEGDVQRVPIYVDSPLATKLTRVFGEHPEVYDQETHADFLQKGQNPFAFEQVHFTESVQESMSIMRENKSHIVISASGMCEAGRILHHLRHKIHSPKHTILIVGYMAQHTLGRRILELGRAYAKSGRSGPPPMVKFFNKEYPLKAHVVRLGGFSAHADKNELTRFIQQSNLRIKKVAVVHGEEDQTLAFADHLRQSGLDVFVPKTGERLHLK